MNFKYRRYLVEMFDGAHLTEIYRPIVPLVINGPKGSLRIRPLLDSGSDFTLFPLSVAEVIGIEVHRDRIGAVGGIEGGSLATYPGNVELELSDNVESCRWTTTIYFSASNNMLLGHLGALEYFTVTLNHYERTFSLEPNEVFPGQTETHLKH